MSGSKRALLNALEELPERQAAVVLDFVEFLRFRQEHDVWTHLSAESFAYGYGADEPEYTESDVKPELDH